MLAVVSACVATAAAVTAPKTVKVIWTPPSNKEDEMDRPKLLNCGDQLHVACAPGSAHGVFRVRSLALTGRALTRAGVT